MSARRIRIPAERASGSRGVAQSAAGKTRCFTLRRLSARRARALRSSLHASARTAKSGALGPPGGAGSSSPPARRSTAAARSSPAPVIARPARSATSRLVLVKESLPLDEISRAQPLAPSRFPLSLLGRLEGLLRLPSRRLLLPWPREEDDSAAPAD